VIYTKIFWLLL